MSARLGRLAGALLLEAEGRWFLVGDRKQPCDFAAAGFEDPGERDVTVEPFVELRLRGDGPKMSAPCLEFDGEGDLLAAQIADRLVVRRNGSVSERLWRLLVDEGGDESNTTKVVNARWLMAIPRPIWEIVRDAVLKCT